MDIEVNLIKIIIEAAIIILAICGTLYNIPVLINIISGIVWVRFLLTFVLALIFGMTSLDGQGIDRLDKDMESKLNRISEAHTSKMSLYLSAVSSIVLFGCSMPVSGIAVIMTYFAMVATSAAAKNIMQSVTTKRQEGNRVDNMSAEIIKEE